MKLKYLKFRIKYFLEHWKLCLHLLLRTKRFGVNNEWWSSFDSIFGWPTWKIIRGILLICPIVDNYKSMKFRARIGFVNLETLKKLGWDK